MLRDHNGQLNFNYKDLSSITNSFDMPDNLNSNFYGSALTLLNYNSIPLEDRISLVLNSNLLSEKSLRIFTNWVYKQIPITLSHPISLKCVDVSKNYSNKKKLKKANEQAWNIAKIEHQNSKDLNSWLKARSSECAAWTTDESAEIAAKYSSIAAAYAMANSLDDWQNQILSIRIAYKVKLEELYNLEAIEYKEAK